jgi:hypothetical protein
MLIIVKLTSSESLCHVYSNVKVCSLYSIKIIFRSLYLYMLFLLSETVPRHALVLHAKRSSYTRRALVVVVVLVAPTVLILFREDTTRSWHYATVPTSE